MHGVLVLTCFKINLISFNLISHGSGEMAESGNNRTVVDVLHSPNSVSNSDRRYDRLAAESRQLRDPGGSTPTTLHGEPAGLPVYRLRDDAASNLTLTDDICLKAVDDAFRNIEYVPWQQ